MGHFWVLAHFALFALICVTSSSSTSNKCNNGPIIEVTESPEDCGVLAGSTAILRCSLANSWKDVKWWMNGQRIGFGKDPRVYNGPRSQLVIERIGGNDTGRYDCVMNSLRGSVNITVKDVPNMPLMVEQKCWKNESGHWYARIKWEPMGDNGSPIVNYSIEYNTGYYQDTWEEAYRVAASESNITFQLNIGMNYTFRVIAVNEVGPSLPSALFQCLVPPNVPFKNPKEVQGMGDEPDNMVISWQSMPPTEHNGPGFFYCVFWKRVNEIDWNNCTVIDNWLSNHLIVPNLPTYVQFDIKVEAHNSLGPSNETAKVVSGYSGEDVPHEAPRNLTLVKVVGPKSADIGWKHVRAKSVKGQFKGYKIQSWTEREGIHRMREMAVGPNLNRTVVNILKPCAENFVRVVAYNGKYNGPHVQLLCILTPEGVPGPVEQFDVFPMTSGFRLFWKAPIEKNGNITGYIINAETVDVLDELRAGMGFSVAIDQRATKYKLHGLQPNVTYRLAIRATTSKGSGDPYHIDAATWSESSQAPDKPIFKWQQKMDVIGKGHVTVQVVWVPDLKGNPGTHFFVQYRKKGEAEFTSTGNVYAEDSVMITALEPKAVYEMRLVALDGEKKTTSDVQEVTTNAELDIFQAYLQQYTSFLYDTIEDALEDYRCLKGELTRFCNTP